ncbi:MAG TPA: S-ribosylhomocysteine lyase [Desulfurobacteriaceae bacterium]|nr:S-ribosylhomocysteine lyase [Desulfurobacteriaceae bacterium]
MRAKVESFEIDHDKLMPPYVRVSKKIKTPKGDDITCYDLRFTYPNLEFISQKGIHSLEHILAYRLREHYDKPIIDISPMGCRTGFYISVIGKEDSKGLLKAVKKALLDVLKEKKVPGSRKKECGNYKEHSLKEAKFWALKFLLHNLLLNAAKKGKVLNKEKLYKEFNISSTYFKRLFSKVLNHIDKVEKEKHNIRLSVLFKNPTDLTLKELKNTFKDYEETLKNVPKISK